MTQNRPVTIISGDILPSKSKTTLSKDDLKNIKNVFSSTTENTKKAHDVVNGGNHTEKRGRIRDPEIHEDWQTVKTSNKLSMGNLNDSKTIVPSRAEGESSDGGRGHLRGSISSLFNPTASEDVRNSEYTDHAIQAGKDRKKKDEDRKAGNREWEVISAAKNTKDATPSQMGFAPLKSAFSQSPIPEVKISEVEAIKTKREENMQIGAEALKIRQDANREAAKEYDDRLSDKRKWEDVVYDDMAKAQSRNIQVPDSGIRVAQDFVKEPTKNINLSLEGLFPVPQNPKDVERSEREDIRRDASHLGSPRIKREDDRSWETVGNAKSKKY
jgi:hypothetical protein